MNKIERSNITNIEIHYIPGHSDIRGNEKVDETVRKAARIGSKVTLKWSLPDILWTEWQNDYDSTRLSKSVNYVSMFPIVRSQPWFLKINKDNQSLDRSTVRIIKRVLSSHGFCAYTLCTYHFICETCGVTEDIPHLLYLCYSDGEISFNFEMSKFT